MTEWKPIETAPKDGSEFIACWGRQGSVMEIVRHERVFNRWISKGAVIHGFEQNATHWTPLPEPPK